MRSFMLPVCIYTVWLPYSRMCLWTNCKRFVQIHGTASKGKQNVLLRRRLCWNRLALRRMEPFLLCGQTWSASILYVLGCMIVHMRRSGFFLLFGKDLRLQPCFLTAYFMTIVICWTKTRIIGNQFCQSISRR